MHGWSTEFIFFAFQHPSKGLRLRRYYVDYADNPYRHRILMDGDKRDMDGNVEWTPTQTFWAFHSEQPGTQAYSVMYAINPYRSTIRVGKEVTLPGWEVHSFFWAYSTPGKFKGYTFMLTRYVRFEIDIRRHRTVVLL